MMACPEMLSFSKLWRNRRLKYLRKEASRAKQRYLDIAHTQACEVVCSSRCKALMRSKLDAMIAWKCAELEYKMSLYGVD